eukprot:gnl/Chilomastix_cuspidata/3736.p1 GENE.gnl/Chilomastix_cuspidata/3736~~gnl/Chilomastix_cuspidata/3736.p1  ORF type:complete len:912 (+),score=203.88 gnl/Chilomastix_cuspidata/3736:344-2737(+)
MYDVCLFRRLGTHPNICCLLGTYVVDGMNAVVFPRMEYSLATLVANCKLTETAVWILVRQILRGLQFLHANGVVHGTLSPHNVLVDRHGRVRLFSFAGTGLPDAHALHAPYQAPENTQSSQKQTPSCDLYAAAGITHLLLTGKTPERPPVHVSECSAFFELFWQTYPISRAPLDHGLAWVCARAEVTMKRPSELRLADLEILPPKNAPRALTCSGCGFLALSPVLMSCGCLLCCVCFNRAPGALKCPRCRKLCAPLQLPNETNEALLREEFTCPFCALTVSAARALPHFLTCPTVPMFGKLGRDLRSRDTTVWRSAIRRCPELRLAERRGAQLPRIYTPAAGVPPIFNFARSHFRAAAGKLRDRNAPVLHVLLLGDPDASADLAGALTGARIRPTRGVTQAGPIEKKELATRFSYLPARAAQKSGTSFFITVVNGDVDPRVVRALAASASVTLFCAEAERAVGALAALLAERGAPLRLHPFSEVPCVFCVPFATASVPGGSATRFKDIDGDLFNTLRLHFAVQWQKRVSDVYALSAFGGAAVDFLPLPLPTAGGWAPLASFESASHDFQFCVNRVASAIFRLEGALLARDALSTLNQLIERGALVLGAEDAPVAVKKANKAHALRRSVEAVFLGRLAALAAAETALARSKRTTLHSFAQKLRDTFRRDIPAWAARTGPARQFLASVDALAADAFSAREVPEQTTIAVEKRTTHSSFLEIDELRISVTAPPYLRDAGRWFLSSVRRIEAAQVPTQHWFHGDAPTPVIRVADVTPDVPGAAAAHRRVLALKAELGLEKF